jgi:hypothetical protein
LVENKLVENKLVENKCKYNFTPTQEDTLFWCLFVHNFGEIEYYQIETKYKNYEIKEKHKIVEYLKSNKIALKNNKITKAGSEEIMSKLLSCNITDLQSINGVCAYYKMDVIIANKSNRTYIEYNYSESDTKIDNTFVVFKSNSLLSTSKCKYSINLKCDTLNIKNEFVKFESFDKPFNGISTYKLIDLETISKKLGLDVVKGKKSEIYKQINVAVV